MNASWYVDPLGRFEGRFWDGDAWTERVKDRGRLAVDPDWPPHAGPMGLSAPTPEPDGGFEPQRPVVDMPSAPATGPASDQQTSAASRTALPAPALPSIPRPDIASSVDHASTSVTTTPDETGRDSTIQSPSWPEADRLAATDSAPAPSAASRPARSVDADTPSWLGQSRTNEAGLFAAPMPPSPPARGAFEAASDAAVSRLDVTRPADAVDYSVESPRRTVAVLGEMAVTPVSTAVASPTTTSAQVRSADTAMSSTATASPSTSRAWLWVLGAAVVLAGLLLVLLPRLSGSGQQADAPDDTTAVTEQPVDNTSSSEQSATTATATGVLLVGALTMDNGQDVLASLNGWFAERNGDDAAPCRMGAIGELAVQTAFCGPTGTNAEGQPVFDHVPLLFETQTTGVVEVDALTARAASGQTLPEGLRLIGLDGVVDPSTLDG